jgi:hypothetical protein
MSSAKVRLVRRGTTRDSTDIISLSSARVRVVGRDD